MSGIHDLDWSPSSSDVAALLRRLQGSGGYSDAATAIHDLALRAAAATLAAADTKIVEAFLEGLISTASSELETWERIYRLTNDAARSTSARRDRLVAAERSYAGGTESAINGALDTITAPASTTLRRAIGTTDADGASELGELVVKVGLTDAAFADPVVRRSATRLARRMLPARSLGEIDAPEADLNVSGGTALAWHSATKRLDRDTVDATTGVTIRTIKSRIRDFGPLSIVRARDLNRIQAETLWAHLHASTTRNVDTSGVGQVVRYVETTFANGATVAIDSSVDWRDRYVHLFLVRSTSDIRPGAGFDGSYGSAASPAILGMDTGAGTLAIPGWGVSVSVSGSGALQLTNNTGSTGYVVGIVVGLPPFYEGRVDDELASPFYDGSIAGRLSKSWLDRMLACRLKPATGLSDPVDSDPVERFAIVPSVRTSNARSHYVIDSSIDWRDRVITLRGSVTAGVGSYVASAYPGANDGGLTIPVSGGVFFSRDGENPATVATSSNVATIGSAINATILVYADSSTGALTLTHIPDGDEGSYPWPTFLFQFFVQATGRFGIYTSAPTAWAGSVTDGNALRSSELNQAQDLLVPSQVLPGIDAPIASFPLGRIGVGLPRIPRVFTDRDGQERRQNVAGAVRRIFAASVSPNSTTVIDTVHDWRDRIVWTFGAASTLPIYRDGANRSSVGHLMPWGAYFRRVGSQWNYGAQIGAAEGGYQILFARESDGALVLVNTAASGVHFVATIEASPKLGPLTLANVRERDFAKPIPGGMIADPDLVAWYDAGNGPIRDYAGLASKVVDRSLFGCDGLDHDNADADMPTWGATSFDGSPGLSTDATHAFRMGIASAIGGAAACTVIMFLSDSSTTLGATFRIGNGPLSSAGRVGLFVNSGIAGQISVAYDRSASSYQIHAATGFPLSSPTCVSFGIDCTDGASPIEGLRVNGTPAGSETTNTGAQTSTTMEAADARVGQQSDGLYPWSGTIGQIAIFRRLLTGAEVARYESEMKGSKYPSITLAGSTSWT